MNINYFNTVIQNSKINSEQHNSQLQPYEYQKNDIYSLKILVNNSLSLFSVDNRFKKNYQKNLPSYLVSIPRRERDFVKKTITFSASQKRAFSIKHTMQHNNGTLSFVHANGIFIKEYNGICIYAILLIDITPKIKSMYSFKSSIDKTIISFFNPKIHTINGAISFYYDIPKKTFYFSKAKKDSAFSQNLYALTQSELQNLNLIHPTDKNQMITLLQNCIYTKNDLLPLQAELRILSKNNTYKWFLITLYPLWNIENKKYIFGSLVQLPSKAKKTNYQDTFTGFYKRTVFEEYVKLSLYHPFTKQAAFILIQLANLEKICKVIGRPLKNMALQDIIQHIKSNFRQTDIFTKYNHNTIAIYLPNMTSKTMLEQKLNAMKTIFDTPYGNAEKEYTTMGYTGIALYPENGISYKSLFQCASKALYKATENTECRFLFYENTF